MDKDEVRRLFPSVVSFADEVRKAFGDGVRLVYAQEGGAEIGKRSEHDPDRVVKLSEMVIEKQKSDDSSKNRYKNRR